jgi:hypothetical protein
MPGASFVGLRDERVPKVRRHTSKRAADPRANLIHLRHLKPIQGSRSAFPFLGGLGTLGAPPIRNVISLHAATPPPLSFSARAIWDDFKDENAANGEHGSDLPLAGTAITTPGKCVERRLRRQFARRENGAVEYLHLIPKSCRMKHAAPA